MIMIFRTGRPFKIPIIKYGRLLACVIMALSAAIVTFWMIISGGLSYFNLDLTAVYDFRRVVGDVLYRGPMAYLIVWATKVFGPTLLALSLWRRKYWLSLIIFCLHVIWFGISSHKSVLFYPLLVVFLWQWFQYSRALSLIPIALTGVVLASFSLYILFSEIFLGSLFIRRVFFVPAHLTFVYYEFFSSRDFVYWSSSFTSWFIEYKYEMSTSREIGAYLGTSANANNSFLSTGYMHAGIPGIILYGVLVGLLFRLIDSLSSKGIPLWLAIASVIVPSQSLLTSVDLPTALLTHGFGTSIVILLLLRSAISQSDLRLANFNKNSQARAIS
jgi:hypothetical protein